MRLRTLSAAAVALLAVASLSGCRTNVGIAATVDGHRITESDVNNYVTAKSKPVAVQASSGGRLDIAPRAYVLETLIDLRLLPKLLRLLPGGAPTEGQLAQTTTRALNGSTPQKVAERAGGLHGFTKDFDEKWVRRQILGSSIAAAQQKGVDLRPIVAKLHFPVSVNPRYGDWNKTTFNLASDPGAGLPGFLDLQPTPAVAASVPPVR